MLINGKIVISDEEYWSLTYPFNMLSRCPALAVPSGVGSNGVPTGIQLVARTYADRKVMEAGKAFETASGATPGWILDRRLPAG